MRAGSAGGDGRARVRELYAKMRAQGLRPKTIVDYDREPFVFTPGNVRVMLDIAFLFWSIAAGIVLAAGLIPLAVFGSVIIGIILLIFVNRKSHLYPYIVVIQCDGQESELKRLTSFTYLLLSCPEMTVGETYTLRLGDTVEEITLESVVTNLGNSSGFGGFSGGKPRGFPGNRSSNS